jgi:uncharacterized membrane protein
MGLAVLILGLGIFLGAHTFITARNARAAALAQLGMGYWVLFALMALLGVVLIAWGFAIYRQSGFVAVWEPPAFMRHITIALMWLSVVLVTAAYLPGHIKFWTKYPMLTGVKFWAFGHLLSNGDLGSILLFGSFLAWAGYARGAMKRRDGARPVGVTSSNSGWTNDGLALVLGTVIFLALGYVFHPVIIGVPVFGA